MTTEKLTTIRWKLKSDTSLLDADDAALIYDLIGEKLDWLAEESVESEVDLAGKNVALVVGHEPGGGAPSERWWNTEVAERMKDILEAMGAKVLIYFHHTKAYSRRCREMRDEISSVMPGADCVILLHYNGYHDPSANGHEFHYRGSRSLAEAFRDQWQKDYPWSKARQNNGILHNTTGRGSTMIRLAPAPCVLTEPFFESNPVEKSKFFEFRHGVAQTYANAIANFLL